MNPTLGSIGGCWFVLSMLHVLFDIMNQSHDVAHAKAKNWRVRFGHCLTYSLLMSFVPATYYGKAWTLEVAVYCTLWLFVTHMIEDTYIPVVLWVKYVRKAPELGWRWIYRGYVIGPMERTAGVYKAASAAEVEEGCRKFGLVFNTLGPSPVGRAAQRILDEDGMRQFVAKPLGFFLAVTIDQAIHLLCLLPLAYHAASLDS